MLEEDSSSARDSITDILELNSGLLKIVLSNGTEFISRLEYFCNISFDDLFYLGSEVSDAIIAELYIAVRRYVAECKAFDYLNRSEYSRYNILQKLFKKGFLSNEILPVLDFLEHNGYINDMRFACSWLRARLRTKAEGKLKLRQGLYAKGVSKSIVDDALTEIFDGLDEFDLCRKAVEKQMKKGFKGERLFKSLVCKGFSFSMVKRCVMDVC